jgi:hypothetical protein
MTYNLPLKYTQSLTTVVKMVGNGVDKKRWNTGLHQSSLKTGLLFEAIDDWTLYCLWDFLCVLWHSKAIVSAFLKNEKVTVLPRPRILQTLSHVIYFCFRNWNPSMLDGNTNPDRHLDLTFISTLSLYPNQRTVTPSRSGYILVSI